MKDLRGIEIQQGDYVSFIHRCTKSGELQHGKVAGFTAQMVKVTYQGRGFTGERTTNYMPHNVCVIQQSKETEMKEL